MISKSAQPQPAGALPRCRASASFAACLSACCSRLLSARRITGKRSTSMTSPAASSFTCPGATTRSDAIQSSFFSTAATRMLTIWQGSPTSTSSPIRTASLRSIPNATHGHWNIGVRPDQPSMEHAAPRRLRAARRMGRLPAGRSPAAVAIPAADRAADKLPTRPGIGLSPRMTLPFSTRCSISSPSSTRWTPTASTPPVWAMAASWPCAWVVHGRSRRRHCRRGCVPAQNHDLPAVASGALRSS